MSASNSDLNVFKWDMDTILIQENYVVMREKFIFSEEKRDSLYALEIYDFDTQQVVF